MVQLPSATAVGATPTGSDQAPDPAAAAHNQSVPINALEDISFTVEPGQLVAIVGPSGSGKTTLSYLIPRLYDVDRGRVLIDGHDVRNLTQASLAEAIGMVTQDTYLLHSTIADNLRHVHPNATQDEIEATARAANIHDPSCPSPRATTPWSASAATGCPGDKKQRLASPGCC